MKPVAEPVINCAFSKLVPIAELKPYSRNRNKHPPEQIERLAKLIQHHGLRHPVIVSTLSGEVIAGNGRLEALKHMGASMVPVDYQDFPDSDAEWKFSVSDNAVALWAELDLAGISLDLPVMGEFDLDMLGIKDFTLVEPEVIPQCDEDEVPEHVEPKTKLGDIYKLGRHRLMCGDSTSIDAVEKLMDGEKAVLMVTDPPYGVKLDQSWRYEALGGKALGKGNKNLVANDERAGWYDVWAIAPAQVAYIWHASSFTDVVMESLRKADFDVRQQIIWNKSVMVMGRSAYHFKHEPCWYAVKKGCDANWKGDRKQTTIWDAAPPNHIMGGSKEDKTTHPTQKPIVLYEIPIANHTIVNDALYEPFGGSGSGIIASEKTNRRCFTMELDPKYCDVIVARWEKYTGQKAELING
jgi:DNA modification methylase